MSERPQGQGCWCCQKWHEGKCPGYFNCKDTVMGFINWKKRVKKAGRVYIKNEEEKEG